MHWSHSTPSYFEKWDHTQECGNHLRRLELAQWQDWERLANGVRHVRPRRRAYVRQDSNVNDAERRLSQGRYNEAEFLNRMAHCTKSLVATLGDHRPQAAEGAGPQRRPAAPVMPTPALNQVEEGRNEGQPDVPEVAVARPPRTCAVCIGDLATQIFIPCGHRCVCNTCADSLRTYNRAGKCPYCNGPAICIFPVFDM